ncbi:hypothetical protein RPMA_16975 [Tardiphaga alba]|uniref:Uncharacterized protein n=1 Tax=Tardiphaga alba TaxID=340268 RepID=A0ABX8AEW6_9BRAD|nr:hypothetical protein [Tardiphaga alba]QUS40340.1 hypothetical protein RPMA_16975 [Tardiphaga alba]
MSDHISFLKARYCTSVLKTATISTDDEARHLIACLSLELPTSHTSQAVNIAERDALASILALSERFAGRSAASVASEWRAASDAVRRWIETSS